VETPRLPGGHAARIAQQRAAAAPGVSLAGEAEKPHLRLVEPGEAASGAEDGTDDGKEYRAYMTAKLPPRLRFKPGWRKPNKSIQWYPTPEIEDDLDRETAAIPQVITVRTPGSVTRIEGLSPREAGRRSEPAGCRGDPRLLPEAVAGQSF
jgi:hypothetical protein